MADQNIALNRLASASSFVMPYTSARAVNGTCDPTSRWLCNSLPGWLMVDLGNYYWINRWVVRHMTVAGWKSPDYNMCDFKLQGSDDNVTWKDIDSVVGNIAGITDRSFTAVAYRYVRLYVTKGLKCNPQMASAMEFEVYQAPASALLTGLTLSKGTLNPVFVSGTFNYTSSVDYSTSSITVTPTAQDPNAIIKVNSTVVASGAQSSPINLNVGLNNIIVQVISSDGMNQNNYTIGVTRAVSAYLNSLVINNTAGAPIVLTPAFSGHTLTGYTSSVDFTTSSITIIPTPEDSAATVSVTVNGTVLTGTQPTANLNLGDNNIIIQVKARDNSVTNQYTVTVTKKHSTYLSGISAIKVGGTKLAWDNPFSKSLTNYTIKTDASKVKITYTLEDSTSTATFKVNNVIATSPVTVPNVITIEVTSTSGIPSTIYTLTLVNG